MEREKMIGEMAKLLCPLYGGHCDVCREECNISSEIDLLYDGGARKIPDGAVVLTREEYERLKIISYIQGRCDANKQSAEMILKLNNAVNNELKEKYGVEVDNG